MRYLVHIICVESFLVCRLRPVRIKQPRHVPGVSRVKKRALSVTRHGISAMWHVPHTGMVCDAGCNNSDPVSLQWRLWSQLPDMDERYALSNCSVHLKSLQRSSFITEYYMYQLIFVSINVKSVCYICM